MAHSQLSEQKYKKKGGKKETKLKWEPNCIHTTAKSHPPGFFSLCRQNKVRRGCDPQPHPSHIRRPPLQALGGVFQKPETCPWERESEHWQVDLAQGGDDIQKDRGRGAVLHVQTLLQPRTPFHQQLQQKKTKWRFCSTWKPPFNFVLCLLGEVIPFANITFLPMHP